MQKVLKIILICTAIVSMCACSSLRFPGVYKLRVQQGNFIDKKMVDQLQVGMTKRQVQFVMGSPLLKDTFSPNRWDYLFMAQRGGEVLVDKRFTVFFEQEQLSKWETDIEFKTDDKIDSNAEKEETAKDIPNKKTDKQ